MDFIKKKQRKQEKKFESSFFIPYCCSIYNMAGKFIMEKDEKIFIWIRSCCSRADKFRIEKGRKIKIAGIVFVMLLPILLASCGMGDRIQKTMDEVQKNLDSVKQEGEKLKETAEGIGRTINEWKEELGFGDTIDYSAMTDEEQISYIVQKYFKEVLMEKKPEIEEFEEKNEKMESYLKSVEGFLDDFFAEFPGIDGEDELKKMIRKTDFQVKEVEFWADGTAIARFHTVGYDCQGLMATIAIAFEENRKITEEEWEMAAYTLLAKNFENDLFFQLKKTGEQWYISQISSSFDYFNVLTGNIMELFYPSWKENCDRIRTKEYLLPYEGTWSVEIADGDRFDQAQIRILEVPMEMELNSIWEEDTLEGIDIRVEVNFLRNGQLVYSCYGENGEEDVIPDYNREKRLVTIYYSAEGFDGTIELQARQGNLYSTISYTDWMSFATSRNSITVVKDQKMTKE